LNGMVNDFNSTILEAVRCNMDIKFIGSGASAKAVLYYITDYITKTELKAHVAFAALELAVKKLGEFNPADDDLMIHAKRLVQCCAMAIISKQELSGQIVSSYLLGLEDHFASHQFRNLYWTSFENFINKELPSPECYPEHNTNAGEEMSVAGPLSAIESQVEGEMEGTTDISEDGLVLMEDVNSDAYGDIHGDTEADGDEDVSIRVNPRTGELVALDFEDINGS
ncbi:hypothetical protein HWV62_23416, partial [Athelia sp. TMB]